MVKGEDQTSVVKAKINGGSLIGRSLYRLYCNTLNVVCPRRNINGQYYYADI